MSRITVSLDEEQTRALHHRAARDQVSPAEVVRRAVDASIAAQLVDETAWRERVAAFLARLRATLPADIPPEETEAEITAAREEVRQARRAARGR